MELIQWYCLLGMMVIFLFCVWRVLNWLWFEPKRKEKFLRNQGLNGTSYKFLFGDLKEIALMKPDTKWKSIYSTHNIAPEVSPFFYESVATHGQNFFTWMGPKPMVHISAEPTMIREILTNYQQFQKPRGENPLTMLLARGLITAPADKWVKHRKIINPAFHADKLKHVVPACYVSCSEMIHKWNDLLTEESSCEVDVWPHLQTFAGDVISYTAFGISFKEGRKIFELQKEQANLVFNAICSIYIPGLRFLPTKSNKRMKEIDREVIASIRSIINKRILHEAGDTTNDDLLGILLDSNYKEIKENDNSNYGLSMEEIIEECKLFYFAGQETTASLLVWTMILLSQHKDWQIRAREEVLHIFGKRKPDIDGFRHLKIINMIFNEILRLYPPATRLLRQIHEETKVGKIILPAETIIQIHTLFLHHNQEIWGDDAHDFKPERFCEGVSVATKGQTSYLPFGWGPRICIGQSFAMLEAKVALEMILQGFAFELSPSYLHAPHTIFTLQPQFGAQLILHKV